MFSNKISSISRLNGLRRQRLHEISLRVNGVHDIDDDGEFNDN